MIARVHPKNYDAVGRSVFRPELRRGGFKPTFPIGRNFSRPLTIDCRNVSDIRKFLSGCKTVDDKKQFDRDDYWQPPEEFEQCKKGDCEDFAIWTWRQLLTLGYNARLVLGHVTRYGIGHAWVTYEQHGCHYLVEPQLWSLGERLPELSTVRYKPEYSVEWDGERAHWFKHQQFSFKPDYRLPVLVLEWLSIWGRFWIRALPRIPLFLLRKLRAKLSPTPAKSV